MPSEKDWPDSLLIQQMNNSQLGKAEEFEATTGWKRALRALQYRNYRLYFGGQGISLIGTWMQRIAMSWLVYRLTDSAFMLGLIGFAGSIPSFIFGPLAGVLADRYNRRRMLVITQSLALLQALLLGLLVLTGKSTIWQILILSIILGFVEVFDMPMRQSFMVEIVQKKDLGNAIALNSSMVNSSRLLGPSIKDLRHDGNMNTILRLLIKTKTNESGGKESGCLNEDLPV